MPELTIEQAKEVLEKNILKLKRATEREIRKQKKDDYVCNLLKIILQAREIPTYSIEVPSGRRIVVTVYTKKDIRRVPKTFEGYRVRTDLDLGGDIDMF